jgi:two-component system response regulator RstA
MYASRCARWCCWRVSAPCCAVGKVLAKWKARRSAWLGEELIDLTGAEFDLLWLLAVNAGRILSREEIFNALRGIEYDGQDRSIDVRISRIRPKIGDDPVLPRLIKTIRGKGYLFVREAAEEL